MSSFYTPHRAAIDLDRCTPAEVASLVDAAIANVVDAALELAPTSDPAELAAAARRWVAVLDRPSLARLCGTVTCGEPRRAVRLVAGVLITTCRRRAPLRP